MKTVKVPVRAIGTPLSRLDGPEKVKGAATYAYEWLLENAVYLYPLQAEIAAGRVTGVDTGPALRAAGVLAVLTPFDAPRLATPGDIELAVLQSDEVAYRGQIVGCVVAESIEDAREAARLARFTYEPRAHDVSLRADREGLHKPAHGALFGTLEGELQTGAPADSTVGWFTEALAASDLTLDATYTTPMHHHNSMEPHTAVAVWTDDCLTVYCSTQGVTLTQDLLCLVLGLEPARVRVLSPHVGGAFGGKVYPHTYAVLAAMAAQQVPGRPVKFALTRQQMFAFVGNRTPTVQRIRLGADLNGHLTALAHDAVTQTNRAKVYAEHAAVCSRVMYAVPDRRTTHRLADLDVPPPTIMRAPGESQGMFALESAMDEMAITCGLDPIEFRIRNEPERDPETGLPFSSRHLVACLREGADRFGWAGRDPVPGVRREKGWLIGTGVAAATYPSPRLPGSSAQIRLGRDGRYTVCIAAADLGTGTWTTLTQIAADALGVPVDQVQLRIGDTTSPRASTAGFSSGISSWGGAICAAAETLRANLRTHGGVPPPRGIEVSADMPDNPDEQRYSMHSFGAQFAEVRVCEDTGETRVSRMLGVFDVGRIINPKTARSQLIGGMTQGMSMALHEHSVLDPRFGHVVNHDFAGYHIPTNADVGLVEAYWLNEQDPYTNPMGSKGLGEVCLVGMAAAIANAVYHATGVRVRELPITLDKLLG